MAKKETLPGIRINKYIGDSGFCSRREADKLITDERVTINGELATLGSRVEEGDKVKIDGEPLHYIPMEQREYKLRRYGASSRRNASFGAEAAEEGRLARRISRNRATGRDEEPQNTRRGYREEEPAGGRRGRHAGSAAAYESSRRGILADKNRVAGRPDRKSTGRGASSEPVRGRHSTPKSRPDEKRRRG
ncbi:S4 domain-containing protein [Barnesiella viscericola]|uniref:S4 domain-containing protein n=1 Tax=Barnesiella viscericola TaxID=397865 RepID=UPI0023573187|nr:S4 domain-containing protein [Barnesiella viscericola]